MSEIYAIDDKYFLDNSTVKRNIKTIKHRAGAQLNERDQLVEFAFGENNTYIQIGEAYLKINLTLRKDDNTNYGEEDDVRLVNNALAYLYSEARLKTSSGKDLEICKHMGRTTTMYKMLRSQDNDLLTYFAKDDEELRERIIVNYADDANRGKLIAHLPLKDIFGFCDSFKKVTYGLGFEVSLKRAENDDVIYRVAGDAATVTINSIDLMLPVYTPSPEIQAKYLNSISSGDIQISYFERVSDMRTINTANEYQLDIGSAANVNAPLYLIYAHQTANRATANQERDSAIFDNADLESSEVTIDTIRYPDEPYVTEFALNKYTEHYREIGDFYREFIGEQILPPYITFEEFKSTYPIFITDLRFQQDYISPKQIQLDLKYRIDTTNYRLYYILIRHKIKTIKVHENRMIDII